MKIIYAAASPIPSKAANSVHVMRMSQALALNEHDVTLVIPGHTKPEKVGERDLYKFYGVQRIFKIKRTFFFVLKKFRYLWHGIAFAIYAYSIRPDLIYSRCLFTTSLSLKLGFKVVFERHDLIHKASGIKRFRHISSHPDCIGIVVISNALKEAMMEHYGVEDSRIIVAHDGADPLPDVQNPGRADQALLKAGYIGHLYEGRGIDIIGETARLLPDVEFHIVGGREIDVEKWRAIFPDQVNLKFHGHVAPSETASYLQSFDILLAPYQNKVAVHGNNGDTSKFMSPLKIFEYMSAGKPIICSDIPVLREVLADGENAYLCAYNDPIEWADKIQYIEDNREISANVGRRAKEMFLKHYTWQARAKFIIGQIVSNSDQERDPH